MTIFSPKHSISKVSKTWLSRKGGELIYIEGDFSKVSNLNVKIDNNTCNNLKILSTKLLSCTTPANSSIKNVELEVLIAKQVTAKVDLKYVGVLGQPSTDYVIQKARGLFAPIALKNIGSKLYIGDSKNNRIVGFNDSSILVDRDFDFVLGLTNLFTSNTDVTLSLGHYSAYDIDFANNLFMVTDNLNHRVLIYDGIPKGSQKPKIVLGQFDSLSNTLNSGNISARSLRSPTAAKFINGKIFVADSGNNRILVWNSIPKSNFAYADFVIGQNDFTSSLANRGGARDANTLSAPLALEKIGNKLLVSDSNNGRVLIWNSIPNSDVPADNVLGQVNMTTKSSVASDVITLSPAMFKYHESTLYLSDNAGNRVLVYKDFDISATISNGKSADIVIGQPNFTTTIPWVSGNGRTNANTISNPYGLEVINNKLIIASSADNRILVYNHLPQDVVLDKALAADAVIGQEGFTMRDFNRTTAGAQYLPEPSSVVVHDGKLFINSEKYSRISVWNSIPNEDFAPADFVLGQDGFTYLDTYSNRSSPVGNPTASTLYLPYRMLSHDGKLIVADSDNNRVLIWNSITGQNGQAADVVLGQANMTSKAIMPVSRNSLNNVGGIDIVDSGFIINDRDNNRILYYDSVPTLNTDSPDRVIGQNDFLSSTKDGGGSISANTFFGPFSSVSWLGRYVVTDHKNRRILFWNSFSDFLNKEPAAQVWGQDDLFSLDSIFTLGIDRADLYGSVSVVDDILYFSDPYNNRVLVFANPSEDFYFKPTSVIGQSSFDSKYRSVTDSFSANTLHLPVGLFTIDNFNYFADYYNNRVLIIPK